MEGGLDFCRTGREDGRVMMFMSRRVGNWNEPFYQGAGVPLLLTAWVPKLALDGMRVGTSSGAER